MTRLWKLRVVPSSCALCCLLLLASGCGDSLPPLGDGFVTSDGQKTDGSSGPDGSRPDSRPVQDVGPGQDLGPEQDAAVPDSAGDADVADASGDAADAAVDATGDAGDAGSDAAQSKLVPCDPDNNSPANSSDIVVNVTVNYNPSTNSWSAPAKCDWACNSNFCEDGNACLASKAVPCDTNNGSPVNSADTIANVTVACQSDGTFAAPAACGWSCVTGYCQEGQSCLSSKTVQCDTNNGSPSNSSDTLANVSVVCQSDGSFATPAPCNWTCNANYCADGNACLSSKSVQCDINNNNPPNSSDTLANVSVACQAGGSFAAPAACGWSCDNGFCLDNGSCLSSKTVQCDTNNGNPPNSTDVITTVSIACQANGTFAAPAACGWACTGGLYKNAAGTACVTPIYLVDAGGGSPGGSRATMNSRCATALIKNFSNLEASANGIGFISTKAADEIRDLPSNERVPTDRPIVGPTGKVIAGSWADLLDDTIDMTLSAAGVTSSYWFSGSLANGALSSCTATWPCCGTCVTATCSNWTATSGGDGTYGNPTVTNKNWISTHFSGNCGGSYHYLCLAWNLLRNGQFNSNTSRWTDNGTSGTLSWSSADADGDVGSGSGQVYNKNPSTGSNVTGVYQCVPVTGGKQLTVSAMYYIPSGQAVTPGAGFNIVGYTTDNCMGASTGVFNAPYSYTTNAWTTKSYSFTPTAATSSVRVRLEVQKSGTSSSVFIRYDNVLLK